MPKTTCFHAKAAHRVLISWFHFILACFVMCLSLCIRRRAATSCSSVGHIDDDADDEDGSDDDADDVDEASLSASIYTTAPENVLCFL